MRVLFITQLFDPENAIKGLSFVKGLVSLGHEIVVVTTFPSYPSGQVYPGYTMRWCQVEKTDGVRIIRVPSYITHKKSAFKRLLSYSTFSFFAFVYSLFLVTKPDVIYSYYPPVFGGLVAIALCILKKSKLVYDVPDLWPEAVEASGMIKSKMVIAIIDRLVKFIYDKSHAIIVISDGYRCALLNKGILESKIHRVYNWCDESRLFINHDVSSKSCDIFNILYAGNLGSAQSLDFVVQAARIIERQGNAKIRFTFIGDGVDKNKLQELVAFLKLKNVFFKNHVPPESIGAELNAADALLVHLLDRPVFNITIPQKLQAYMAAGKPILVAVAGEASDIVKRAGAGVAVRPCDPQDIANGALLLSNYSEDILLSLGISAREFYMIHMSQSNGIKKTSEIINNILRGK